MLLQRLGIRRGAKERQGNLAETSGLAGDATCGSGRLTPPVTTSVAHLRLPTNSAYFQLCAAVLSLGKFFLCSSNLPGTIQ